MPAYLPSGAIAVVKATISASGHRPWRTSSSGPDVQLRIVHDARGRDLHQHGRPQHREQHQGGGVERDAAAERIGARAAQRGAAARAVRPLVGPERRHDLEHPAAETLAQLGMRDVRLARSQGPRSGTPRRSALQERREPVGELANRIAGAATWPAMVAAGTRLGDAERPRRRLPRAG